jgi:hypothetical protein
MKILSHRLQTLPLFLAALALMASCATATCPCEALGTWCQYAPPHSDCPRQNVCHGTTTPCDCDSCPTNTSSCAGCKPTPPPVPGKKCESVSDCPDGWSCCMCNCNFGDTPFGDFSCNCNDKHKPLPVSQQPTCCGGPDGLAAWCAKAGTSSATNPQCTNKTTSGAPTPSSDFYEFGLFRRCVNGPCHAGFCDNPIPPHQGCQE